MSKKNFSNTISAPFQKASATIKDEIKTYPLIKRLIGYPLVDCFLKDKMFRAELSLRLNILANSLYAIVMLGASIFSRSIWSGALSIYNLLLAVIRFSLIRSDKSHLNSFYIKLRRYRLCGIFLLLMTPIFAGILILVVKKNIHSDYPGFLIYLVLIYTLYKIVVAITNVIKFKRCGNPVISAAKIISLIDALMSILSLETAFFSQFESMKNSIFYQDMIGTSGGAVCIFALVIAILMIVRANNQLKEYR